MFKSYALVLNLHTFYPITIVQVGISREHNLGRIIMFENLINNKIRTRVQHTVPDRGDKGKINKKNKR